PKILCKRKIVLCASSSHSFSWLSSFTVPLFNPIIFHSPEKSILIIPPRSLTNNTIFSVMLISLLHNLIIPTSNLHSQPRHSTKTFILLCIDPLTSNPLCTVLLARLGLFPAEQKITFFLTRNFIDIILERLISSLSEYT